MTAKITLIDFHISQSLPFIHGNNPFASLPSTTEIDDQFLCIVAQRSQDIAKAIRGELCVWKEERSHNDLLCSFSTTLMA